MVLGRKALVNYHLRSKFNPSDDPSRFAELREPKAAEPWMKDLLETPSHVEYADSMHSLPAPNLRKFQKLCRELYAGQAGLSRQLFAQRLRVAPPLEAHPEPNKYVVGSDLSLPRVLDGLIDGIVSGVYFYLHFGFPCRTWGNAARRNNCTRTQSRPEGTGELPREVLANQEVRNVIMLCRLLIAHGGHFSLENPKGSYAWIMPEMLKLIHLSNAFFVEFDQCEYGLTLPGSKPGQFCRKRTSILTTLPSLASLKRRCSGVRKGHGHIHAWDTVKVGGKWLHRAACAGTYPDELCREWATLVAREAFN